jgi:DNA-binding transcriptional regulator/RsmH inhibitor MraZ
MAPSYSIVEIELRSEISMRYTNVHPVRLVFRPLQRLPFRFWNNRHLVIPDELLPVGTELFLTADPAGCLLLLGADIWERLKGKLLNLPASLSQGQSLKRILIGNGREVSVNSKHRLELAPELAEFAQLEKIAYWVKSGNLIELWNPDSFTKADGGSWVRRQLERKVTE